MAKKKKEFCVETISIMTAMTTQNQSDVQLVRLGAILTLHQQEPWRMIPLAERGQLVSF
jgi:hypothetical protein